MHQIHILTQNSPKCHMKKHKLPKENRLFWTEQRFVFNTTLKECFKKKQLRNQSSPKSQSVAVRRIKLRGTGDPPSLPSSRRQGCLAWRATPVPPLRFTARKSRQYLTGSQTQRNHLCSCLTDCVPRAALPADSGDGNENF